MNDRQFKEFIRKFNTYMDLRFDEFDEKFTKKLEQKLQSIEGKIDWQIGEMDNTEVELRAQIIDTERNFAEHDKRIKRLELSIS